MTKGDEYSVKEILDVKLVKKTLTYYVSWTGYGPEGNTWEPVENLENCRDLITSYHREHNKAAAPKRSPKKSPKTSPKKGVSKKTSPKKDAKKKAAKSNQEYEIEAIVAHKKGRGKGRPTYNIRWEGYDSDENTWEPEKNLEATAPELLSAYQALHKIEKKANAVIKSPAKAFSPAKSPVKSTLESPSKSAAKSPRSPSPKRAKVALDLE